MIGERFGSLTVVSLAERRNYRNHWLCKCDCGTEKVIRDSHLTFGKIVSCGCHRAAQSRKHGLYGSAEYWAWNNMRQRCSNPKNPEFKNYGARGIAVSEEWSDSFEAFLRDVGPRPSPKHTLERVENSKGYEAGNVEWRTMHDQSRNKRNNVLFTINGETKTLQDWVDEHGIASGTVRKRLKKGQSIEDALNTPPDEAFSRDMTPDRITQEHVELDGETLPLSEWAKKYNINISTLRKRLRSGKSLRDALAAPINARYPRARDA